MEEQNKSSNHEIGDTIKLDFYDCGSLTTGIIAGIKFTDYGKVLYDIKLKPFISSVHGENDLETILKDVDSYFVKSPIDNLLD